MRALTVVPLQKNSASVENIDEPTANEGDVLVETLAVGVCGTDIEILSGDYGWSPPGTERLVLGHESIGKVIEAPSGSDLKAGDLVVGIVRRPDPVPCYACAHGEWDNCRNGQYTEHGIKELHGFMRERYRAHADALMPLPASVGEHGVLLEPTTVVAKAWEQASAVGNRATWEPRSALIVGAGPIGLLAALLGRQRGLEVTVVDQVTDGPKPDLVARLGATYHAGPLGDLAEDSDVVIECTGVPSVVEAASEKVAIGGVICLTGISPVGNNVTFDLGSLARDLVLGNKAIVGSVNANRRHYEAAAKALAEADADWLGGLISRRVPLEDYSAALERQKDDVKVVITLPAAS